MAIRVPKFGRVAAFAIVTQFNLLKRELAAAASKFHADITSKTPTSYDPDAPTATSDQVTAADGDGTPAKTIALANDIMNVYLRHLADAYAHKLADPPPALTTATDLTSAQTLLNAIKADLNTHRASTTYHYTADATNAVTSPDATNQASADTLANEMKGDLNAHITGAVSTQIGRAHV